MNLITLLGAAVGCKDFADSLFADPQAAAQSLRIVLTQSELKVLEKVFCEEAKDDFTTYSCQIRTLLCKHPPCPFIVNVPGLQCTCFENGSKREKDKIHRAS